MTIRSAELIAVGTELLLGDIVNTDSAYIARRLAALGIGSYRQTTVGDNPERLAEVLTSALKRCELIIMTGGLGPTCDDLTKEVAASVMGRRLSMHAESLARIEARLGALGAQMTENSKKQALIPEGSVVFRNDYGTAPGMAIEDREGNRVIILLPGPPRECEPMFREQVEPYLAGFSDSLIFSRTVNIFGMGEARVEELLRGLMESKNPTLAPYAKDGEVQLRITASGKSEAECAALCDEMLAKLSATPVGKHIYGIDKQSLEEALVPELIKAGLHIASAESCTGGSVAKRLTDIPGASEVLDGSIVTYANSVKERFVNVSRETLTAYGAVSEQTAREMARGVRELFGADIGVSTTGIAGPGGGTPAKPVGTVFVGISAPDFEDVRELHIGSSTRALVRHISASNALHMALSYIIEKNKQGDKS